MSAGEEPQVLGRAALSADLDAALARAEAAEADRDDWKATAETAMNEDAKSALIESSMAEVAAIRAERDVLRVAALNVLAWCDAITPYATTWSGRYEIIPSFAESVHNLKMAATGLGNG